MGRDEHVPFVPTRFSSFSAVPVSAVRACERPSCGVACGGSCKVSEPAEAVYKVASA